VILLAAFASRILFGADDKSIAAWVNEKPIAEAQVAAKMQPVIESLHRKLGRRPDGTIRMTVRETTIIRQSMGFSFRSVRTDSTLSSTRAMMT
jgi:hypothetical protein